MDKQIRSGQLEKLMLQYKNKIKYIGEKHPKIKQVKALLSNSKPNPENLFAGEGIWLFTKVLELNIPICSIIFCPQLIYTPQTLDMVEKVLQMTDEVYAVSDKVFAKISDRDKMDGLFSICRLPKYDINHLPLAHNSLIVVLDGCEIPGNVGTIARTCDGAAVDAIFLCNRRIRLTHPKVIKGSMGGALVIPFIEFASVAECRAWLLAKGFSIYMADTRAEKYYYELQFSHRTALIAGSEKYGISKEWYTEQTNLLSIPMQGTCDSLNVGVAASIILYDMSRKLGRV